MTLQPNPIFHNLSHRTELGAFLNARGLTGKGVEVGTLFGANATDILKTWKGHLYCVDPWLNQDEAIYNDGANREHDMNRVFAAFQNGIGRHERCTGLRMFSLNAVGKFEDGELSMAYLDGNHGLDSVRADIAAWWPKLKIGGILCGHDFFTRYDKDTNSDALTAVCELCEAISVRPHVTWCTSWYIEKTEEADAAFFAACVEDKLPRPVYSNNFNMPCVVVLPVARFDWNLACRWMRWVGRLATIGQDEKIPLYQIVVHCSPDLTDEEMRALDVGLMSGFADPAPRILRAPVDERGYFGTPNQMFRTALEYCEREFPGHAVLWCEADTVPMRPSWVDDIMAEYRICGRPFMGDIQRDGGIPHLTGNAVYHPEWRKLAPSLAALGQEACGWDSLCAHDILPRSHYAKTIQQVWRPPLPITDLWAKAHIHPETALFHQCKDGSLIDVLCLRDGLPLIPLAPALCESTYERDRHMIAAAGPSGSVVTKRGGSATGKPVGGTEILIVSCARDAELLAYCLKSITRYATGFSGVTLVVPAKDARAFAKFDRLGIKLTTFDEVPGKGMMHHEIMICRADELCPHADQILHMDSDCLFWQPVTPAHYVQGGRCQMVRERYDEIALRNPNRLIWGRCVQAATGIVPEWECMVRHPNIYPRALYSHVRSLVELHTRREFNEYVLSCENGFPQGFCEFDTISAVAIRDMPDKFNFVHYDHGADGRECGVPDGTNYQYLYRPGRDAMVEGWSHGGVGRYKMDWDKFLLGKLPAYYLK